MSKSEVVTRPVLTSPQPATREWVEDLIDRKLARSLKLSEETTNKIVSGLAGRLFKHFPKAIADAVAESNPGIAIDTEVLSTKLEAVFQPKFKQI